MANITNNFVIIKGKKESLDRLIEWGETHKSAEEGEDKEEIRFSSYIPMPQTFWEFDTTNNPNGERLVVGKPFPWDGPIVTEELVNQYKEATKFQKETYGVVGWYDWRRKNYGVKWDCPFKFERISHNKAIIPVFETPWCAPEAFFCNLAKDYDGLTFTMYSHFEDDDNEIYEVANLGGEVICAELSKEAIENFAIKLTLEKWILGDEHTSEEEKKKYLEYLNNQYIKDGHYDIICTQELADYGSIIDDFLYNFEDKYEEE